jgi:capsular exopolysaccharide synthesis family protein
LPPALSSAPDVSGLLRALQRRWFLAGSLGLLAAAGVATAAWNFLPAKHTAIAQMHIESMPPWIVFPTKEDGRNEFRTYSNLQIARIKSRLMLNQVLKSPEVQALPVIQAQPEPMLWLEDNITVELPENSEVVKITMIGQDPTTPVTVVNRLLDAYLKDEIEADLKKKRDRLSELDKIHVDQKERVRHLKELLKKRADELGSADPTVLSAKQVELMSRYGELRKQQTTINWDRVRAEIRLKHHIESKPDPEKVPVPESALTEAVAADPSTQQMSLKLGEWITRKHQYERIAVSPQTEPGWKLADQQEKLIKEQIDKRAEEVKKQVAPKMRQKIVAEWNAQLIALQKEVEPLRDLEQALTKQIEELRDSVDKIGGSSVEIEQIKAEIAQDAKVFERVADEYNALQIELNSPPRVTKLQDAALQRKDMKQLLVGMVGGPMVSFFGVVFGIAWLEFRARRVQTTDEVSTGLGVRVVGAVPPTSASVRQQLLNSENDPATLSPDLLEAVDGIRTLLLRDNSLYSTRVVMVTSAVAGEGKTSLASQLASSLARAGRKTLLVDCDLRAPSAHQLFELPLAPGFSEVLLGEVHLAEATRSTSVDGLWMIPAGNWDREVMTALARDGVSDVFDKLKTEYDFIIVDSHPVLAANDSQLIGQQADAVLLALLKDVSQTPRVYAACQRLHTVGARVLGAVVQGLPAEEAFGCRPPVRA